MTKLQAELSLIMVTFAWGVSFILMDVCLAEMGPFNLNALRFLGAFVVAYLLFFRRMKGVSKTTLKYGALLGAIVVLVYLGATLGTKYTNLAEVGFLCNLTVIITPILTFVFLKCRPEKKFYLALAVCVLGMCLLQLQDGLNFAFSKGEMFCVGCAFFYAVQIILTEKAVKREDVNAVQLGIVQLGFTGFYNLIISLLVETPQLPESPKVWGAAIFLSLICSGAAFIIQTVAQQHTSANRISMICSMEPVFSCLAAYIFLHEVLSLRGYIGGALMVIALFILEIDFKLIAEKVSDKGALRKGSQEN